MELNEELKNVLSEYEHIRLPRWEELPNFDIYMDQLITLVNRYLYFLQQEDEPIITRAMVNNYVKLEMIPKPIKKRYQRTQIAYLIAISVLKQVLTISEVRAGIDLQVLKSGSKKEAYDLFCDTFEDVMKSYVAFLLSDEKEPWSITFNDFTDQNQLLKACSVSLVTRLACRLQLQSKVKKLKEEDEAKKQKELEQPSQN